MNLEITQNNTGTVSPTIAQEVRFRCPHCQKLYCTQNDVFEGSLLAQPGFDCMECHKTFTLTRDLNEVGLYITTTASQVQFAACPKCSHLKPLHADECPSCGVLASKYEEMQKVESPYLFQLNQLWQRVLADFTRDDAHQKFIAACHQKMALNFAFNKYQDLKNTVGFDMSCDHYMRQVELRLEEQFRAQELQYAESRKPLWSRTQILFFVLGVVGVFSLIYNKVRPTFPNLTGLVVALTILSFGLGFFSGDQSQSVKLDKENT